MTQFCLRKTMCQTQTHLKGGFSSMLAHQPKKRMTQGRGERKAREERHPCREASKSLHPRCMSANPRVRMLLKEKWCICTPMFIRLLSMFTSDQLNMLLRSSKVKSCAYYSRPGIRTSYS